MVQGGMVERDVIVAATATNAAILGIEQKVGTIEKGKLADLIAVPDDPLKDISRLRHVEFVMQEGRIARLDTFISCETINTGTAGVSGEWLAVEEICNRSQKSSLCRLLGTLRVFNPGGETTAVPSQVALFLSEDDVLDENDSFLTTEKVKALEAGEETIVRVNLKLPDGANTSGSFIIAVVDFYDDISERNEANNVAVSPVVLSSTDRPGSQIDNAITNIQIRSPRGLD
jgi:hypothetical protein